MRVAFAEQVLQRELLAGNLGEGDSILALCAGQADQDLFSSLRFTDVTLTNLDVEHGHVVEGGESEGSYLRADAQDLPFPDGAFDVVFVSDGLHHCRAPHRALAEMWRTARRGVIVIESRDSITMRAALAGHLTSDYELNSRLEQTRTRGGADFGPVPNFVFRWTEREFEKTLRTFDPEHDQAFAYYYGLDLPPTVRAHGLARFAAQVLTAVAPQQGNTFAMIASKGPRKPYLDESPGGIGLADGASSADIRRHRSSTSRRRHRVKSS